MTTAQAGRAGRYQSAVGKVSDRRIVCRAAALWLAAASYWSDWKRPGFPRQRAAPPAILAAFGLAVAAIFAPRVVGTGLDVAFGVLGAAFVVGARLPACIEAAKQANNARRKKPAAVAEPARQLHHRHCMPGAAARPAFLSSMDARISKVSDAIAESNRRPAVAAGIVRVRYVAARCPNHICRHCRPRQRGASSASKLPLQRLDRCSRSPRSPDPRPRQIDTTAGLRARSGQPSEAILERSDPAKPCGFVGYIFLLDFARRCISRFNSPCNQERLHPAPRGIRGRRKMEKLFDRSLPCTTPCSTFRKSSMAATSWPQFFNSTRRALTRPWPPR